MRLCQFISRAGYCSRRQASRLIEAGDVLINDQIAGHLSFVNEHDVITVCHEVITLTTDFRYVIYHKPIGVDCNCVVDNPASIVNQLDFRPRLFPVGRLDKDSHGLLLLTNDGDLCHQLLSPASNHSKTYRVTVKPFYGGVDIDERFVTMMSQPITLKQGITKACQVKIVGHNQFEIILTQGLNRQIRKMAQYCGYQVTDLQRVSIIDITLGPLQSQHWRELSPLEVEHLKQKEVK
ncbi:MAG: rRNA pseudouridine synthase [Gammaproteobacteria bacterium]|nr:rRNA pseudouridine synthase [Gammaproteobacteria bacterium]